MDRIDFLGYPVDNLNFEEVFQWMEEIISSRKPSTISVINANKVWQVSKDERLSRILKESSLVIPEWAVYWGAGVIGKPLKEPVYGVVLIQEAIPWAAKKGFRPYFLGAKQQVIDAMLDKLKSTYPDLQIAGAHNGYFKTAEENAEVCRVIKESNADILFVAMGSPRQEYWINENLSKINVPIAMGVGGSFDVIAGLKSDTPSWARGHGIEWVYRLSQDPKAYWKRYMVTNPWFIYQVYRQKFTNRL